MGSEQKRVIMLADCQSFYASVEKAANPQYANKPLVVAGDPERRSGIILAACPMAKKFGITTAERLGGALAKCPDLVVVRPRMQTYMDVSMQITEIYRSYTDLVEPYSIDEQFIDVTGSQRMFGDPLTIAKAIQERVWNETRIHARFGVSYSKVTAKMACDNFAKKSDSGLFMLLKEEMQEKLWPLDISELFMVGRKMREHFYAMGIRTIGALAQTPLPKLKERMRRKFGKNCDTDAELYWRIANGIDDGPVNPWAHSEAPKSIGHQMTLPRDYATIEEISVVLLELAELVCLRCRSLKLAGATVLVGGQGSDADSPRSFFKQMKMPDPTNVTNHVYKAAVELFKRCWDGTPVRRVAMGITQLSGEDNYQLTMFEERDRYKELERTTDELKRRFGDAAILRAASATEAGQAADRARKIGGHYR